MNSDSSDRCVIFDLDGVLVDTRDLVCEAYRHVGVTMPDDAWGKAWHEWLPGAIRAAGLPIGSAGDVQRLRQAKQRSYVTMLSHDGTIDRIALAPARLASRLITEDACQVYVVAGASFVPAVTILRGLNIPETRLIGYSLSAATRTSILRRVARNRLPSFNVVYVDDLEAGRSVAERADIKFVRYDEQDELALLTELEERWNK